MKSFMLYIFFQSFYILIHNILYFLKRFLYVIYEILGKNQLNKILAKFEEESEELLI